MSEMSLFRFAASLTSATTISLTTSRFLWWSLVNAAVWSEPTVLPLSLFVGPDGDSQGVEVYTGSEPCSFLVGAFPLPSFGLPRPHVMKMDVEGSEYLLVPAYDFQSVQDLAIEFHGCFVADYMVRTVECRDRLKSLGFDEVEWRTSPHPEGGWLRLASKR